MKAIKLSLIGLVSVYLINLLTMWLFGRTALVKHIQVNSKTSYQDFQWTPNVNLLSDLSLDSEQVQIWGKLYAGTDASLRYLQIHNVKELKGYTWQKDMYSHIILTDSNLLLPALIVEETENIGEYMANWEFIYVWVLFDWIKIAERSTGTS